MFGSRDPTQYAATGARPTTAGISRVCSAAPGVVSGRTDSRSSTTGTSAAAASSRRLRAEFRGPPGGLLPFPGRPLPGEEVVAYRPAQHQLLLHRVQPGIPAAMREDVAELLH